MTLLRLHLEGDGCWPDLADRMDDVIEVDEGVLEIALLPLGAKARKPSLAIRINLPDGKVVIAQTTAAVFLAAAAAVRAKYSDA